MNKNQQHRTDDHQRSSLAYPIVHITESGVRNKVPNGNRLGIVPANSGSTLYFCTIRSVAYFKKGNTAE